MDSKYNLVRSVERAFSILQLFSKDERSIGLTTVSKRVGLHKSTCFGLLYTLQQLGYVQQDAETGQYGLGLKAFELGQAYIGGLDLRSLSRPLLAQLGEATQETVHLVLLEGLRAIYIDKVEVAHAIGISSRVGQEVKLHCTAVGKALLAHMAPEDLNEVLSHPLERFTPQTITDRMHLVEHLQRIRERGFAVDDHERDIGLRCIGAPIFNARGSVVAGISISAPSSRLSWEKVDEVGPLMRRTAQDISRHLGYGS